MKFETSNFLSKSVSMGILCAGNSRRESSWRVAVLTSPGLQEAPTRDWLGTVPPHGSSSRELNRGGIAHPYAHDIRPFSLLVPQRYCGDPTRCTLKFVDRLLHSTLRRDLCAWRPTFEGRIFDQRKITCATERTNLAERRTRTCSVSWSFSPTLFLAQIGWCKATPLSSTLGTLLRHLVFLRSPNTQCVRLNRLGL